MSEENKMFKKGDLCYLMNYNKYTHRTEPHIIYIVNDALEHQRTYVRVTNYENITFSFTKKYRTYVDLIYKIPAHYEIHNFPTEWAYEILKGKYIKSIEDLKYIKNLDTL